jgi:hypothetical protein
VQIEVLLTDDAGRDSASVTAASVTSAYVLSGRITNKATGSPVGGAVVTITFGAATGRRATSDATGAYCTADHSCGAVELYSQRSRIRDGHANGHNRRECGDSISDSDAVRRLRANPISAPRTGGPVLHQQSYMCVRTHRCTVGSGL